MCPQHDRKKRLNKAVCRNHRIKRVVPCRCLNGHVKEPCECLLCLEPDRRSNFSPPTHLCAFTYMTEISLIVTLNNQFTSPLVYGVGSPTVDPTSYSACTYFCRHIYDWNIVNYDVKQPPPLRAQGVKSRMCHPYPQLDRKRRLNGAVCRNHHIKRVVPCRC